jgi:hypothetical protein
MKKQKIPFYSEQTPENPSMTLTLSKKQEIIINCSEQNKGKNKKLFSCCVCYRNNNFPLFNNIYYDRAINYHDSI